MIEMFAYALGVMYTPGPVNSIAFTGTIGKKPNHYVAFSVGVGLAMFLLCSVLGYLGDIAISPKFLPAIAFLSGLYISYLASKIYRASSQLTDSATQLPSKLHQGFTIQLLNPKAPVALLPLATFYFPSLGIENTEILIWSVVIGTCAFGAPASYSLLGWMLGKNLKSTAWIRWLNKTVAIALFIVAGKIMISQGLVPIWNTFQ